MPKTHLWLLTITYKRRKGSPQEHIAICNGGALEVLFLHQHLYQSMRVPGSWIDFKLMTAGECRGTAPSLYGKFRKRYPISKQKFLNAAVEPECKGVIQ